MVSVCIPESSMFEPLQIFLTKPVSWILCCLNSPRHITLSSARLNSLQKNTNYNQQYKPCTSCDIMHNKQLLTDHDDMFLYDSYQNKGVLIQKEKAQGLHSPCKLFGTSSLAVHDGCNGRNWYQMRISLLKLWVMDARQKKFAHNSKIRTLQHCYANHQDQCTTTSSCGLSKCLALKISKTTHQDFMAVATQPTANKIRNSYETSAQKTISEDNAVGL